MQGPHRHFDGKGQPKSGEEPELLSEGKRIRGREDGHVEGTGVQTQPQDAGQHQQRTAEGVEHEFDGRVQALLAAHNPIRKYMGMRVNSQKM